MGDDRKVVAMTDNESRGTGESSDTGESRSIGSDKARSGQMGVDASHALRTETGPRLSLIHI